jgi:hypothetical protein
MCAEFNIYHLMDLEPGEEFVSGEIPEDGSSRDTKTNGLFRLQVEMLERGERQNAIDDPSNRDGVQSVRRPAGSSPGSSKDEQPHKSPLHVPGSGPLILGDIASILRSKNAGPYEVTFDVIFDSEEVYRAVKNSDVLNQSLIEDLYALRPEEVIWCGFFDQARAFKATIPRKRKSRSKASGGFGEVDVHGSQMYIPLFGISFPEDVSYKVRMLLGA